MRIDLPATVPAGASVWVLTVQSARARVSFEFLLPAEAVFAEEYPA